MRFRGGGSFVDGVYVTGGEVFGTHVVLHVRCEVGEWNDINCECDVFVVGARVFNLA